MAVPAYSSFAQWHRKGRDASYLRMMKSSGGIFDLLKIQRPAGDMSRPALPDIVLFRDSSNQVLARVFLKHMRLSPSGCRRAIRDPVRQSPIQMPGAALATSES